MDCFLTQLRGRTTMGLKHLQGAVRAVCLVSAVGALADNVGWYFSRANCYTANESLTWKIDLTPSAVEALVGIVVPGTGFTNLGIPAYRKTTSKHYHKYVRSKNHSHISSIHLECTWRSHAGSFPFPEAFPYVNVELRYNVIWTWEYGHRIAVTRGAPYLVVTIDAAPWVVAGTHHESTSLGGATVTRHSSATGCNWDDTFNSMGGN